mgnify:CR=1 FL=1
MTPCCGTPAIVWSDAWTWRCLTCNTTGTKETAAVGDPWGLARRPSMKTVQVHAGADYTRGYVDGRVAAAWEIVTAGLQV